jgi:hypothetical protein
MGFLQRSGTSLTFIASEIAPALAAAIVNGVSRWPTLATFASRGTVRRVRTAFDSDAATLRPWQVSLLEAANLGGAERAHPSAALTRRGEAHEISTDAWAHLQCVHFAAGLNDLAGVLLHGAARLSDEDRTQIAAALQGLLRADGYELHSSRSGDWLVRLPRALEVRTVAPETAFTGPLDRALPQGRDAAALRRLMTELQMVLHEHPVNVRRARAGLPAANAVWLWGIGAMMEHSPPSQPLPTAFGSDGYLKGLYLSYRQSVRDEPFSATVLANAESMSRRVVVLENVAELDALESEHLRPLLNAMRAGSIARLELHLDQWRIAVNRSELRRFWKRPVAPNQWVA